MLSTYVKILLILVGYACVSCNVLGEKKLVGSVLVYNSLVQYWYMSAQHSSKQTRKWWYFYQLMLISLPYPRQILQILTCFAFGDRERNMSLHH